MFWNTAAPIAAEIVSRLELPADLRGLTVNLATFSDDATCRRFYPGRPLDLHRIVNLAIVMEVRRRGGTVSYTNVTPSWGGTTKADDPSKVADAYYYVLGRRSASQL